MYLSEKWEEQFAEFKKETGIKVVPEFVPVPETMEKTITMAAIDMLPDVIIVSALWHCVLAERVLFANYSEIKFETLDINDFWSNIKFGI